MCRFVQLTNRQNGYFDNNNEPLRADRNRGEHGNIDGGHSPHFVGRGRLKTAATRVCVCMCVTEIDFESVKKRRPYSSDYNETRGG